MQLTVCYILSLALMGGIVLERLYVRTPPRDATGYHEHVAGVVRDIPLHVGAWYGRDIPVTPAAVRLLRPNVIVSREYENIRTGQRVQLLLVHCQDSRDLLGHYPPICYPNQGWVLQDAHDEDWSPTQMTIGGKHYIFETERAGAAHNVTIMNFMVLPDIGVSRDMDAVDRASRDQGMKFYGAGQVQLVMQGLVSPEERQQIIAEFAPVLAPAIEAITHGRPIAAAQGGSEAGEI